jgi:cytochrome c553
MLLAALLTLAARLLCDPALPASPVPFEERVALCLACHGEMGQSSNPEVPSLGAQTAPYALIQLYMFRQKLRINEIMNDAIRDFSDDDLRTFSDFIAKLPAPTPPSGSGDPGRLQRGRALVQQHRCDFCHDRTLAGRDDVPRIAGQREDFLAKTLREYKSNARAGYDSAMASVVQPLTEGDIDDLAYFTARQP